MRFAWTLAVLSSLVACGGAEGSGSPVASSSSGSAPSSPVALFPLPRARPSSLVPWNPMPGPLPSAVSQGGRTVASPRVVALTFDGDPERGTIESVAASLGASGYWREVTSEYGVGPLVAAPPIHIAVAPPRLVDDDAIETLLAGTIGAPDPSTVYAVFYPEGTAVTYAGFRSCQDFAAYHGEAEAGGGGFAYAVLPRCPAPAALSDDDWIGVTTSHEILEASTNPRPVTEPAFDDVDDPHAIWTVLTGGELADLCGYSFIGAPDLPTLVQRSWSNASALAGRDPCVPAPVGPFFSAVPALHDAVSLLGRRTLGARVALGDVTEIDVALASDTPCEAWNVTAIDLSEASGGPPELALSLDRATGAAGDTLRLSLRPLLVDPLLGGEAFAIVSESGGRRSIAYGFVAN